MERILVVEDDIRLAGHLSGVLEKGGYVFSHISSLQELDQCLDHGPKFDAVILDRLLDGADSKGFVARVKKTWPSTAILILSAINTPLERAELLNVGADDYLGKPFLAQELLARLRAVSRRSKGIQSEYREIGDLVLNLPKRLLLRGDRQDSLPSKEFLILKLLTDNPGRVVGKTELLDSVWFNALDVESNVVEATMANLRKRLSELGSSVRLRNSRNFGYWIES